MFRFLILQILKGLLYPQTSSRDGHLYPIFDQERKVKGQGTDSNPWPRIGLKFVITILQSGATGTTL